MNRLSLVVASIALTCCSIASAQLSNPKGPAPAPAPPPNIEQAEKFLYLVDHFARLSDNATSSAIAAVLQASEVLSDRPLDAIEYFNRTLPDVKNDSVRRVIRLQLADLYRRTNQPDKALDQLRELMILAPAGSPHPGKTTGAAPVHSGATSGK